MAGDARFSKRTLDFLKTAGEQTDERWLEKNSKLHDEVLVQPLRELAHYLSQNLSSIPASKGYRFPKRGFARLKRPSHKVGRGEPANRDWVHLQASRISISRFDENPALYFYMSPTSVFAGGGLYMATSRQVKQIRAKLAEDGANVAKLFKSKPFKEQFPDGFETDKVLKTFPRFYPQDHKRIEWLRLQAFYVKRDYSKREVVSADFKDLILENWIQTLRFNEILYDALVGMPYSFTPANVAPDAALDDVPDEDVSESPTRNDLWDDRL